MKAFIRTRTLSSHYYRFAVIVALVVMSVSLYYVYDSYQWAKQDRSFYYVSEADKIADDFYETVSFVERLMEFIGERIAQEGYGDPQKIADILRGHKLDVSQTGQDIFTWTLFDFVTAEGFAVASSTQGVLPNPKKVTGDDRSWIISAKEEPWRIHLAHPAIGYLSGQLMISPGYGVTDELGKFLGYLSTGLSVAKLTRKLEKLVSEKGISFVLLTDNMDLTSQSSDNTQVIDQYFFVDQLAYLKYADVSSGYLRAPVTVGGVSYGYYKKLDPYPFVLLVGGNQEIMQQKLAERVYPKVQLVLFNGVFFIMLILYTKRRVIKPVTKLSDAAISISQGQTNFRMPKTHIHEYDILSAQLNGIADFIEELRRTRNELYRALDAKSNFLSRMSHELRTPLNAIIGFSEMMKDRFYGDLNDKYCEYATDIHLQGLYLLSLIEQILNASKFEAGVVALREEVVDIARLVKDSVRAVIGDAQKKHLTIDIKPEEGLTYLYADKMMVRQVLLNLLSNAVKFTEEKGRITIRLASGQKGFVLEVQDTGIGIAEEDIPKVVQRFGQINNAAALNGKGTGLGMSITKDIVELHGGTLKIQSQVGVGTTVTVLFPPERIRPFLDLEQKREAAKVKEDVVA